MEWDVVFYETGSGQCLVRDFLDTLNDKQGAKVLRGMQLVREFGPELGMPYVETIQHGLQCLRIKHGSDIFRVLFCWTRSYHRFLARVPQEDPEDATA